MIRKLKDNATVESFNSLNEFINTVNSRPLTSGYSSDSHKYDKHGWTGTKTYEEADNLMRTGYAEGLKKMREIGGKVKQGVMQRKVYRASVVGGAPHVQNAIAGLPNSMMARHKEDKVSKTVDLYYSISVNGGVEPEQFVEAGAKVLSLVSSLERKGLRVRLHIMDSASFSRSSYLVTIKVKDYTQPMNALKMSYIMCHPSFLRRHSFAWLETAPFVHGTNGGYGYAMSESRVKQTGLIKKGQYFVGLHEALRCKTEEDLLNLIGMHE